MGLLGFRKELDGLMGLVGTREEQVRELLEEKRDVRRKIEVGRRLIDYDARLKELEAELMIEAPGQETTTAAEQVSDSEEDEDEDDEEQGYSVSVVKLRRNVVQYRLVLHYVPPQLRDRNTIALFFVILVFILFTVRDLFRNRGGFLTWRLNHELSL